MLKDLAHLLTSPINQAIILVGFTWLLSLKFKRIEQVRKRIYFISIVWLYLCSQPFFSYQLMKPIEDQFPPIKADDNRWQSADAIWVLACNHYDDQSLPDVSRWNTCSLQRLVHTYMMYKHKPTNILVTGGDFSTQGGFFYADRAKEFLVQLGVDENDIVSIPIGTNTLEEYISLKKSVSAKKLAVVSSASHGPRLSKLLEHDKSFTYIFIPVEHLNAAESPISFGLPKLASIEKSRRAIYTYFANIELWFSDY